MEGDLLFGGKRPQLRGHGGAHLAHVDEFALRDGIADIDMGEREHVFREAGEALDFLFVADEHVAVFLGTARFAQRHFDLAAQHGEWRAQLVGGIGSESLLSGVRGFETVEQMIEGGS